MEWINGKWSCDFLRKFNIRNKYLSWLWKKIVMYVKSLDKTLYNKFSPCHRIESIQGLYIYIWWKTHLVSSFTVIWVFTWEEKPAPFLDFTANDKTLAFRNDRNFLECEVGRIWSRKKGRNTCCETACRCIPCCIFKLESVGRFDDDVKQ